MPKDSDQPGGQEGKDESREERKDRPEEEERGGGGASGMNTPSPRRGNTPQGGFWQGHVGIYRCFRLL